MNENNLESIELKNRIDSLTLKEFETFLKIYELKKFNKKVSNINSYAEVDDSTMKDFLKKYYEDVLIKHYSKEHKVCKNFKDIFKIIYDNFKSEKIIPSPENLNEQISKIIEKTFNENKLIKDINKNQIDNKNDIKYKINEYITNNIDFENISKFLKKLSVSKEIVPKNQGNIRKELKNYMIDINIEIQQTLNKTSSEYQKSIELDKKLKGYNDLGDLDQNIGIQ
jgi:hypothetical protein